MNVRKEATMNWEDAPDTITPEIYAQLRGRSVRWARSKFKEKNFPLIDNGKPISSKTLWHGNWYKKSTKARDWIFNLAGVEKSKWKIQARSGNIHKITRKCG